MLVLDASLVFLRRVQWWVGDLVVEKMANLDSLHGFRTFLWSQESCIHGRVWKEHPANSPAHESAVQHIQLETNQYTAAVISVSVPVIIISLQVNLASRQAGIARVP
jgi:hypothetical protein